MKDITERLKDAAEAYPVDIFPPVTAEQRDTYPAVVTRASAQMGRHFSPMFIEAAKEIEILRELAADAKTFVAFAYANGVMGAEECGRRIEAARPALTAEVSRTAKRFRLE